MFTAVSNKSSADAVYDQVADEIFAGTLSPGTRLPGERELANQLAVSRSVVREALQRLAHSGLVEVRQGGATRVLDYQESSDLGLLNHLIVNPDGSVNVAAVRSILHARITIGADAATLCAGEPEAPVSQLHALINQMEDTADLTDRQHLDLEFWGTIVAGSGNVVYRLAYNGLAATYRPIIGIISAMVEPEVTNLADHRRLISAIEKGDARRAQLSARSVLTASNSQWESLLGSLEKEND